MIIFVNGIVIHKKIFLFSVLSVALCIGVMPQAFSNQAEREWDFITRNGSTLIDGGKVFRFAGVNIHWLGLDDPDKGTYPSFKRIDEAFNMATALNATVVRSHTLGISIGCESCVEPALNHWNETAFLTIDHAIASARNHHIRLIIPLVDNWQYYHGGKHTFTEWRGDKNEDDFFSNPEVIADFKVYIAYILNHRNQFTGIALKDDPTIMAWETGNELENASGKWDDGWTENIAAYIKNLAPRQLINDGHRSSYIADRNLTASQLKLPDVDMYTGHFYPPRIAFMQKDAAVARQYEKVYFVGEYDWSDQDAIPAAGTVRQDSSTYADGHYSADINVSKSNKTNGYYIQLGQGGLFLGAGQLYELSFSATADRQRFIEVMLQESKYPYTTYYLRKILLPAGEWNKYSYSYTPPGSYNDVTLRFNLAQDSGDVWLDNVALKNGTINFILNPSFEQTGAKWLAPWKFQVKQRADTLTDFLSAIENTPAVSGDLFWQLYGHYDNGQWARGDKYTLYYPPTTDDMQKRLQMLVAHAKRMDK